MTSSAVLIDDLLRTININELTFRLKEFLLDVMFLVEADIKGKFTKQEKDAILLLFTKSKLNKLLSIFEKVDVKNITEVDLKYILIKCSRVLNDSKVANVITRNNKEASKQHYQTAKVAKEVEEFNNDGTTVLKALTEFDFE